MLRRWRGGPTLGKARGAYGQSEEAGGAAIAKVRSSSKVFDRTSTAGGRYDVCRFQRLVRLSLERER